MSGQMANRQLKISLKDQIQKQYHGILKLDAITLKNLDAKGNQATWSAEGDVSSSDDLYTWVGQLADYELLEQTWTKDKPVKFSAMLTSKGTPASGWSVNFYSFQAAAAIVGGWSTISKRIINI